MRVAKVEGVKWNGREVNAVMILRDGPLTNESVVFVPTYYLLHLAKAAPLNTLLATASDLNFYFEALEISGRQWDEITDDQMSGYLESTLASTYKLSEKSITRHRASIDGMYTHLSKSGFTERYFDFSFRYYRVDGVEQNADSPTSENFKLRKKYINEPLYNCLLENVPGSIGFVCDRNELILELGYQLGLRAFEVTHGRNLKIADLQEIFESNSKNKKLSASITIFGKRKKSRTINIPPDLLHKMEIFIQRYEHLPYRTNLISSKNGKLLAASFACKIFNTTRNSALPKLKEVLGELHKDENAPYTINWKSIQALSFHCMRHTYATNLVTYCYDNNIDPNSYLPTQLGHTKPSTTKQYTNFEAALYNRDSRRKLFSVTENSHE